MQGGDTSASFEGRDQAVEKHFADMTTQISSVGLELSCVVVVVAVVAAAAAAVVVVVVAVVAAAAVVAVGGGVVVVVGFCTSLLVPSACLLSPLPPEPCKASPSSYSRRSIRPKASVCSRSEPIIVLGPSQ